jgi:hypothetical protein
MEEFLRGGLSNKLLSPSVSFIKSLPISFQKDRKSLPKKNGDLFKIDRRSFLFTLRSFRLGIKKGINRAFKPIPRPSSVRDEISYPPPDILSLTGQVFAFFAATPSVGY